MRVQSGAWAPRCQLRGRSGPNLASGRWEDPRRAVRERSVGASLSGKRTRPARAGEARGLDLASARHFGVGSLGTRRIRSSLTGRGTEHRHNVPTGRRPFGHWLLVVASFDTGHFAICSAKNMFLNYIRETKPLGYRGRWEGPRRAARGRARAEMGEARGHDLAAAPWARGASNRHWRGGLSIGTTSPLGVGSSWLRLSISDILLYALQRILSHGIGNFWALVPDHHGQEQVASPELPRSTVPMRK
ncbi:hypothetical protein DFH08DRAFT_816092 [Mycena albidolilacea]|uniref:Uncharacterized protein n=1 Tax=Mycena albidolilacea TaxID=1033008 RepID=A0AAD7EJV9_9AGAR|nr:hypothetical protein DFH08DRAFT_816092 [Mycena albidolilacea]